MDTLGDQNAALETADANEEDESCSHQLTPAVTSTTSTEQTLVEARTPSPSLNNGRPTSNLTRKTVAELESKVIAFLPNEKTSQGEKLQHHSSHSSDSTSLSATVPGAVAVNGTLPPSLDPSSIAGAPNAYWIQCEKCYKWRKLSPFISPSELPEVWHCSMNTWDLGSSTCDAPEESAEGQQDINNGSGGGASSFLPGHARHSFSTRSSSLSSSEVTTSTTGDVTCQASFHSSYHGYATEIPMITAELADAVPPIMIRAEPVPHPVEARPVQVHVSMQRVAQSSASSMEIETPSNVEEVHFDEDDVPQIVVHGADHLNAAAAAATNTVGTNEDDDSITKMKRFWSKNAQRIFHCNILLLIVGLVLAVTVPKLQESNIAAGFASPGDFDPHNSHGSNNNTSEDEETESYVDFGDGMDGIYFGQFPSPTPAPSYQQVYPCYHRTLDMALAQVADPSKEAYVICPNTKIPLGTLADPENDDFRIVNGDYPLTVVTDNVEVRCGLDGRRDNHCVLDGGFLQVLLAPSLPDELAPITVNRTDNVVFRGITFTGSLESMGENTIGGVSVLATNPGVNITFVDCAWEDMVAPQGLIEVGDKNNAWAFAPSTSVSFEDCTFSDIEYSGPLIGVFGQDVTVRESRFNNIRLPEALNACPIKNMGHCNGLLYCFEHSFCELEDICVNDMDYAGPAAIASTSYKSTLMVSGWKHTEGLNVHRSAANSLACDTELAEYTDTKYQQPECLDDMGNWTRWTNDTCFL